MTPTAADLARENEELRHQLREAEELITAVRTGAVDALAIQGAGGPRIFTLESADHSYRSLVEQMSEGAALLAADGFVLYCNAALAQSLGCALSDMMGHAFTDFVPPAYHAYWAGLWEQGWATQTRGEMPLQTRRDGVLRPFSVSMNKLNFSGLPTLAVAAGRYVGPPGNIEYPARWWRSKTPCSPAKPPSCCASRPPAGPWNRAAAEASRMLEGIPQIAWMADSQGQTNLPQPALVRLRGRSGHHGGADSQLHSSR